MLGSEHLSKWMHDRFQPMIIGACECSYALNVTAFLSHFTDLFMFTDFDFLFSMYSSVIFQYSSGRLNWMPMLLGVT